jgi:hypothetical protein
MTFVNTNYYSAEVEQTESGSYDIQPRLKHYRVMLAIIRKRLFLDSGRAVRPQPTAAPGRKHAEWIDPSTQRAADSALRRGGQDNGRRHSDWSLTLIRHGLPTHPLAICSLAQTVSVPARLRTLMAPVGCAPLNQPSARSAGLAAVALPTVAVAAHEENRSATRPAAKT